VKSIDNKKNVNYPLGGLLVFIIFVIGFFFLRGNYSINLHLLSGIALIYLIGLIDDYKDLSAKIKLFLQLAVISYLVFYGIRVTYVTNPFEGFIYFEELSIPVTVIWILMMVNLMNLLNVLKGMASGIAMITSVFIIIIAWDLGRMFTVVFAGALLAGLIVASLMNRKNGNWELGNSGSMLIGALLAIISIVGAVKSVTFISLFLPIILLGVPIINGFIGLYQVIFSPKFKLNQLRTRMLHHVLLDWGISEDQSRQILYIITFVFGLAAFLLTKITTTQSFMIIILIAFFFLVYFRELRHNSAKKNRLINVKLLKDIQLNLYQIRDKLQYKLANGELTTVREEISELETILSKRIPSYFRDMDSFDYNFNDDDSISYQLEEILNVIENVFDTYYSEFDNLNYILRDYQSELRETKEKLDQIYMKLK
jgi:UDP-N-acetylmuramyl pentapeptide phosphotransferase/UDP-N-acetylglucosamine-1-phosphate transferase/archaellum component FlaC